MDKSIRRLPIGIQSFESLREDSYCYVDKSAFIYKMTHTGRHYFLSRPRRFGKSLFLSMMRAYWEGKRELFEGLQLFDLSEQEAYSWEPHPVFYVDFNRGEYHKMSDLETILDVHLKEWEMIYGCTDPSQPLPIRFQNVLVRAARQTGKRCVVLADEYDKPLLDAMQNPELEEHNRALFKSFFSALKSFDEYLIFVLITGVTKFSKISIFSDLNQLEDISMDRDYAELCGITEEELKTNFLPEVHAMADETGLSPEECLQTLKSTYDGYHFHQNSVGVYNPFSLLNALKKKEFDAWWFETGTPSFLIKQLKDIAFDVRKFSNRTLYANRKELSDYRGDNPDPIPLLYQTGYLTIVDYDARRQRYTLGFPNEEVKYGLMESLMPVYLPASVSQKGLDIYSLDEYLEKGDVEGIRTVLTALFASIPYTINNSPFEHYFQTVIYVIFTLLGKYAQCEIHSSQGRADCIVAVNNYIYIFEFKIDSSAEEALRQIDEKGYVLPYSADKRDIYKIGVSFDSNTRTLKDWKAVLLKK